MKSMHRQLSSPAVPWPRVTWWNTRLSLNNTPLPASKSDQLAERPRPVEPRVERVVRSADARAAVQTDQKRALGAVCVDALSGQRVLVGVALLFHLQQRDLGCLDLDQDYEFVRQLVRADEARDRVEQKPATVQARADLLPRAAEDAAGSRRVGEQLVWQQLVAPLVAARKVVVLRRLHKKILGQGKELSLENEHEADRFASRDEIAALAAARVETHLDGRQQLLHHGLRQRAGNKLERRLLDCETVLEQTKQRLHNLHIHTRLTTRAGGTVPRPAVHQFARH